MLRIGHVEFWTIEKEVQGGAIITARTRRPRRSFITLACTHPRRRSPAGPPRRSYSRVLNLQRRAALATPPVPEKRSRKYVVVSSEMPEPETGPRAGTRPPGTPRRRGRTPSRQAPAFSIHGSGVQLLCRARSSDMMIGHLSSRASSDLCGRSPGRGWSRSAAPGPTLHGYSAAPLCPSPAGRTNGTPGGRLFPPQES